MWDKIRSKFKGATVPQTKNAALLENQIEKIRNTAEWEKLRVEQSTQPFVPQVPYPAGETWEIGSSNIAHIGGTLSSPTSAHEFNQVLGKFQTALKPTLSLSDKDIRESFLGAPTLIWSLVLPPFLLKEYAGESVNVEICVDKAAGVKIPGFSLYYAWDLPSLSHTYKESFEQLFCRLLSSEVDVNAVKQCLLNITKVYLDITEIHDMLDKFIAQMTPEARYTAWYNGKGFTVASGGVDDWKQAQWHAPIGASSPGSYITYATPNMSQTVTTTVSPPVTLIKSGNY